MRFKYLFSAPGHDVPVSNEDRARPFLMAPATPHPFLSLGDYLDALTAFLSRDRGAALLAVLNNRMVDRPATLSDLQPLLVRTEKHGALYHIASVECLLPNRSVKLAITTAVTEENRRRLTREYSLLNRLHDNTRDPALPEIFCVTDQTIAANGDTATLTMMLGEWFDDYHEWHISREANGTPQIRLWDMKTGYRFLDKREQAALLQQVAAILTRHYDPESGSQIYPWHHAAGDFVVCGSPNALHVKLITTRDYEPLLYYPPAAGLLPGLLSFFLHLTIRMRLDRLDGVGEPVWLDDFSLPATIAGFAEELHKKNHPAIDPDDTLELLKEFSREELLTGCEPLLALYEQEDAEDTELIRANLKNHCRLLQKCLQGITADPQQGTRLNP